MVIIYELTRKDYHTPSPPKGGTPPILRGEKSLILPLKRLNRCKQSRFHLV